MPVNPTVPSRHSAEPLTAPRCRLAESPRWSGDAWWWVDADAGDVWTASNFATIPAVPAVALGERTSLVHPADQGEIIVARGTSIERLVDSPSGWRRAATWSSLSLPEGTVINDGTADSAGRLWVGSVGPDKNPETGTLIRIERDGKAHKVANGFALSNGMAWDDATNSLLHVDSLAKTVWRHRISLASGEILGSQPFVQLEDEDGLPDGIVLDAEGHLWVAVYGRGEVRRYRPNKQIDRTVELPTAQATSVAIGGQDGLDLLITTAREGFDPERSAAEPHAGLLYRARSSAPATRLAVVRPQR